MNLFDYILDSTLVLLVLLQIREQPLTRRALIRPLIIVAIAVVIYVRGFPTGGNDLLLGLVLALVGGAIGVASGVTVWMRPDSDGRVLVRAGIASAVFWVLGMGSRFAFIYWITHSGADQVAQFSEQHAITGADAWTVALLAMAVAEVIGRTIVLAVRKNSQHAAAPTSRALA